MIRCLAGASSSATITQRPSELESVMGVLSGPSQRQRYFNLGSTTSAPVHRKTGFFIGIESCQTLPRHGKPHAPGVLKRPARRKSHAVVEHTNVEPIADPMSRYDHRSTRSSP